MTDIELQPERVDATFVPMLRHQVELVPVGDEAVLYDNASGALHHLSPIAALVCRCFDGRTAISSLSRDLGDAFGVDVEVIQADVVSLARELGGVGVLRGVLPTEEEQPGAC